MKRTEPTLWKQIMVPVFADYPWWVGIFAYGLYGILAILLWATIAAYIEYYGLLAPDDSVIVFVVGVMLSWTVVADRVVAWLFGVKRPKG